MTIFAQHAPGLLAGGKSLPIPSLGQAWQLPRNFAPPRRLRLVAVKVFGPVEITASLGVLYESRGTFATGEAVMQISLYLPFFRALKVYGEALGRGAPAYIQKGVTLPLVDGLEALHQQAVIGGGLSFRPSERVDLGVSVQRGFGGLARVGVLVRFLTLRPMSTAPLPRSRSSPPMPRSRWLP